MVALSNETQADRAARDTMRGFGYGLLASGAWALYSVASRSAVESGFSAVDLTAIRYIVAALVFLPLVLRRGIGDLGGIGWGRGTVLALGAGPIFSLLYVYGLSVTPYTHGPVLSPSTVTLASLLLAALVLRERVSALHLAGAATVIVGLFLVVSAGDNLLEGASPFDLMFIASGFLWAGYTVMLRKWRLDPVLATASVAIVSGIAMLPLLVATGDWDTLTADVAETALHALMQGVVAAGLAVVAFSKAVSLIGASRAGLFPAMVPVLAILLGIPLLDEIPNAVQVMGVLTASAGLILTTLPRSSLPFVSGQRIGMAARPEAGA